MFKCVIAAAAVLSVLAAGSAITTNSYAGGGSASAVKRTSTASNLQASNKQRIAQTRANEITEFSSSSAGHHAPGR